MATSLEVYQWLHKNCWCDLNPGKDYPTSRIPPIEDWISWVTKGSPETCVKEHKTMAQLFPSLHTSSKLLAIAFPASVMKWLWGTFNSNAGSMICAYLIPINLDEEEEAIIKVFLEILEEPRRWKENEELQSIKANLLLWLSKDVKTLEEAYKAYSSLPEEERPERPPLYWAMREWLEQPRPPSQVVAVVVGPDNLTKVMMKMTAVALHEAIPDNTLNTPAAAVLVDGEAITTRTDGNVRAYRARRQPKANRELFGAAGISKAVTPCDPLLYTLGKLRGVDGRNPLRSDVFRFLSLGAALASSASFHIDQLAAWLSGEPENWHTMGNYRKNRLRERAWETAFVADTWWVPVKGGYRKLLRADNTDRRDAKTLDIKPYRWQKGDPWRLTSAVISPLWAKGVSGQFAQNLAALEDYLAASGPVSRNDSRPRLLVPENNRKRIGPGRPTRIRADTLMARAGFDVSRDPKTDELNPKARKLWERFMRQSKANGLVLPGGNMNKTARAGSAVEIVGFTPGVRGHAAQIWFRASARRVEAQRKAAAGSFDLLPLADVMGIRNLFN